MEKYFATLPGDELAAELQDRVTAWATFINKNGLQKKWWKSYRLYYGKHFFKDFTYNDSEIARLGDKGEYSAFAVNHYASIIRQILTMTTNQQPAFDARAINNDSASLQQAKLANNILDAYMREKKLGRALKVAAEHALIFGKGFVFINWDPSLGEKPYGATFVQDENGQPVMGDDGQPMQKLVYEGDIDISNPSVFDVFVDQSSEDFTKCQWVNIRTFKNKFDLGSQYPQFKDQLAGMDTKAQLEGMKYLTFQQFDLSADIPVYYFFHKPTRAMPNGRLVIYTKDGPVLYDGPCPYDELPVFRIVPHEIYGTTEGYTVGFDLIGLQEAYNVCVSSVFTNIQANAIQKIYVPEGGNVSATMISKGLAIIRGPAGAEPKALQLTQSPAEIYNFMPMLQKMMENISNVNSVVRGDPEHSLKSGVALGLVQSMAVQSMSAFQQSWAQLLEDCGTFIVHLLQKFAKTERMISMAGKHYAGYMQAFKGDDLNNIKRVTVELGNPMSRTLAGRFDLAKMLIDMGQIKQPQDLISVLETGNLDRVVEGPLKRADLVNDENERLADGKPVTALVGDSHLYHAQEHLTVIADPALRAKADAGDPMAVQIVTNTNNHVMQHLQLYQTQLPIWSMISGEPPAPPMGPPIVPPQGGEAPPMGAPMEQGPPMPANAAPMPPGPVPPPLVA